MKSFLLVAGLSALSIAAPHDNKIKHLQARNRALPLIEPTAAADSDLALRQAATTTTTSCTRIGFCNPTGSSSAVNPLDNSFRGPKETTSTTVPPSSNPHPAPTPTLSTLPGGIITTLVPTFSLPPVPTINGGSRRVYIDTSSNNALVNQWAVIPAASPSGGPGSRLTFTPLRALASNLSVIYDPIYQAALTNPTGSALQDLGSLNIASSDQVPSPNSPDPAANEFTVVFDGRGVGETQIIPQANPVARTLGLAVYYTDLFGNVLSQRANILQACGGGAGALTPWYLVVSDHYNGACQNVTLKYV